jgi:hypothetical protein
MRIGFAQTSDTDFALQMCTCELGGIDEGLSLRRPEEGRHHNHAVHHGSPLAGGRGDALRIMQDAGLFKETPEFSS